MSSSPPSAITSASPSFWQVMPRAPAARCRAASIGLLWVLMWGRLAMPALSQAACRRRMLASTRSRSTATAGVPYSRAILRARSVMVGLQGEPSCGSLQRAELRRALRVPPLAANDHTLGQNALVAGHMLADHVDVIEFTLRHG